MVIAITGVVVAMVAIFIVPATTAYFASRDRAQLGDQADTALRLISRDLTRALPNSARVNLTGLALELIPVSGAARYATESGNPLRFGVATAGFDLIGPPLNLTAANQRLAFYNLGPGVPDADAYTGANVRSTSQAAGPAASISWSAAPLPTSLMAPPYRVYAIESPVSYRCDITPGVQTLTRYVGYALQAVQPDPPSGGTSAVLARNVSACQFSYDASTPIAARYGLVTLRLSLTRNSETIALYQAVHVDNLP